MAVVVNEFEVVPGGNESSQSSGSTSGGDAGDEAPSPREIERLVEQQMQRCERVWAH